MRAPRKTRRIPIARRFLIALSAWTRAALSKSLAATQIPRSRTESPALQNENAPTQPGFQISETELARGINQFSQLRAGMTLAEIQSIVGKPDGVDRGLESTEHSRTDLLGLQTHNHNENLAYVYFVEHWTPEIATHDPLHDRYVVLLFLGNRQIRAHVL